MTRILAIETSTRQASLALLEGEQTVQAASLPSDQRTAQALAPAMKGLLDNAGWPPSSVELVAVTTGPGSFTGLRLGITAAKTWAYATGTKIIGVNTLEVLAAQVPAEENRLWTLMDAQRQEVFAAMFQRNSSGQGWQMVEPTEILSRPQLLQRMRPGDLATGSVLKSLAKELLAGVETTSEALWIPQAETVGALARRQFGQGNCDDPFQLVPNYFRKSAAEEKAEAEAEELR